MLTSPPIETMLTARSTPSFFSAAGPHLPVGNRWATPLVTLRSSHRHSRPSASRPIRAVISSDDKSVGTLPPQPSTASSGGAVRPAPAPADSVEVRVVLTVRDRIKEKLAEKIENQWEYFLNGIGQGITVQLVSEELDPVPQMPLAVGTNVPKRQVGANVQKISGTMDKLLMACFLQKEDIKTNTGKRTAVVSVRGFLPKSASHPSLVEYAANLIVPSDFGRPGAIRITNLLKKEFYLVELVVHGFSDGPFLFPANSWIQSHKDNPESCILFSNQSYLPSQTPDGLKALRQDMLDSLRGNGKGERKKSEMIYDYAPYNDLGNPDKDADLARPILSGSERPYPRRCRTGRPPTKSDPRAESRAEKPHPVYVPRDETFEEIKQSNFSAGALRALFHNLIPAMRAALSSSDSQFECFSDIDRLYKDGLLLQSEEEIHTQKLFLPSLLKNVLSMGQKMMKYDIPSIISRDRFAWLRDNEFARQTLAGVNPVDIERLRAFPILSKLDPEIYGPPESAITKECLEHELNGMSLQEAMDNHKLFIIDYHDILLPFVKKINSLKGRKIYASRTILFQTRSGLLRPIAIELSLPPTSSAASRKRVYVHGHDATTNWVWKLAKAHVCANDAGVHQLVNHWLRTHAAMEPYIIATHRQLSSMHPVHKLLHPHMRYTMEINALARQSLINAGGIIENCFTPGKYAMELSSAAYKGLWRFDMEALPADLIRRGMAIEDPSMPGGLKLVIEDYPYAADGLLVWSAIEQWVKDYITHYYTDNNTITSDVELQAWWDDIKNKGHPDKRNEPWWPTLNTKENLILILTTMIWTASGQHAAINFGQYPFGGYMPNRPTLMKKLIPQEDEDEPEYQKFLLNPQLQFLQSLPSQLQATQVMAVQDTLSSHSEDEEYLGQIAESHAHWTNDRQIVSCFEKFAARLEEIEDIINRRNRDFHLKNRSGAGVPPYELLLPSSGPGVTGRGIPNSISI